jgi:hypothetical protein
MGLCSVCLRLRVVRLAHESRVCALLQVGNFEKALDRLCHWATNFTMTKFGPNLNTLTGRRKAMSENAWLLDFTCGLKSRGCGCCIMLCPV